jgi:hypothetical protein
MESKMNESMRNEFVEEFGVLNFSKIEETKKNIQNDISDKKDLLYLVQCFYTAFIDHSLA